MRRYGRHLAGERGCLRAETLYSFAENSLTPKLSFGIVDRSVRRSMWAEVVVSLVGLQSVFRDLRRFIRNDCGPVGSAQSDGVKDVGEHPADKPIAPSHRAWMISPGTTRNIARSGQIL